MLADHADDLLTFLIGFEGMAGVSVSAEKTDEIEFSDLIVARFKTRHHKLLIPDSELLARLPEAVAAMTEPMMSHDAIAFYLRPGTCRTSPPTWWPGSLRIRGSKLWHLALLEWWLQVHVDGVIVGSSM